jgi:hypothetical protein
MQPYERRPLTITVKIPPYATSEMVHVIGLYVNGYHGAPPAELQLTTLVSAPTTVEHVAHVGLSVYNLFVQGDYAYLAAGRDGLRILNISNPDRPVEVGFYAPENNPLWSAEEVIVRDHYAYVAAKYAGLCIIDISDPTRPVEVGAYSVDGYPTQLTIVENYAYAIWPVCGYPLCSRNLQIIDLSDPVKPVKAGSYNKLNLYALDVVGHYLYLTAGAEGLYVLDVSTPAAPLEIGYHPLDPNGPHAVQVSNGYAYVLNNGSLKLFDVTNPTKPVELGRSSFKVSASKMTMIDSYLYLTGPADDTQIIDISNPANPVEVAAENPVLKEAWGIAFRDNIAYLATAEAGLWMVDMTTLTAPQKIGTYGAPGFAQAVAVANHYAYVADRYNGLRIFDVAEPARPVEVGFFDRRGGAQEIAIKDHYAYVAFDGCPYIYKYRQSENCDAGTYLLDISDPALLEVTRFNGWKKFQIVVDYAYVLDEEQSLHIFDISDPTAPVEVNALNEPVNDFNLVNGLLYLLPPNNFRWTTDHKPTSDSVLKIVDPISLAEIGSYHFPELNPAQKVVVAGQHAYVYWNISWSTGYSDGWLAVNVSDPTASVLAEKAYKPWKPEAAAVDGSYVYIADATAGFRILNISTPSHPVEVDAFGADHPALDVTVAGGYIYLANGSGGLHILRYPGVE